MSSNAVIDLTLDDDEPPVNHVRYRHVAPSISRRSSDDYIPALAQDEATLQSPTLKKFSSYEIKSMSLSRITHTRLPDILQHDQKKGIVNASHPSIFVGWVQEHEESSAPLSLTNEVDSEREPVPSADWMYTDGYVLHEKLEEASRLVGRSTVIPKGCNCNNELGICDPKRCSCYTIHEKLAPNPWIEQTKLDVNGKEYKGSSDIRRDFAYREGRLRKELISWPRTPIWECNSHCSCSADCRNRLVQKGRTVAFDLFKSPTPYKGWGIRTRHKVKAGTFITIYAGELLGWTVSEDRAVEYEATSTTYILDIDSHHIKRKLLYEPYVEEQKRRGIQLDGDDEETQLEAETWAIDTFKDTKLMYSVDAGLWGNLSRYLNHSCDPNLELYPVYTEERDIRRPFLAFFARTDILEGEELTFAYDGATEDGATIPTEPTVEAIKAEVKEQMQARQLGTEITVKTSDGKHNLTSMKCGCGSRKCRGTVFIRGD